MSNWRVLGVRIARLQRAHDHLAGVHPNANLYRHSPTSKKSVAVTANLTLHTERRMKRALLMVLMGDGRTEEREDAISGILYVAVVAPRGVDHYFQRRVDDRARLLGIEVLLELGRALDIGKQ